LVRRLIRSKNISLIKCFRVVYLWINRGILILMLWLLIAAKFRYINIIWIWALILLLLIFTLFLILLSGGCLYIRNLSLPARWQDSLSGSSWTHNFWSSLTQHWFRALNSFRTLVSVTGIRIIFELTGAWSCRIYI